MPINIYCCYHNKSQIDATAANDGMIWYYGPEDPLNKFLSEFSMWRDIMDHDETSTHIGVCHYRRRLPIWHCQTYARLMNEKTAIIASDFLTTYRRRKFSAFDMRSYLNTHYAGGDVLTDDYIEYIKGKYGQESKYIDGYNPAIFVNRCCAFMRREEFMELCDLIFGYFDYIDEKYKLNKDPQKYEEYTRDIIQPKKFIDYRQISWIGEFIYNIYVQTHFTKMYPCEYIKA